MTLYYINIFWKDEWTPIYIVKGNEALAVKLLQKVKDNWRKDDAYKSYNINIESDITLDVKYIEGDLIYDCDWFAPDSV